MIKPFLKIDQDTKDPLKQSTPPLYGSLKIDQELSIDIQKNDDLDCNLIILKYCLIALFIVYLFSMFTGSNKTVYNGYFLGHHPWLLFGREV